MLKNDNLSIMTNNLNKWTQGLLFLVMGDLVSLSFYYDLEKFVIIVVQQWSLILIWDFYVRVG